MYLHHQKLGRTKHFRWVQIVLYSYKNKQEHDHRHNNLPGHSACLYCREYVVCILHYKVLNGCFQDFRHQLKYKLEMSITYQYRRLNNTMLRLAV